jgi:hypothetical protein
LPEAIVDLRQTGVGRAGSSSGSLMARIQPASGIVSRRAGCCDKAAA